MFDDELLSLHSHTLEQRYVLFYWLYPSANSEQLARNISLYQIVFFFDF
jgi:hypothetical protein